jgi:hypothetical protein
VFSVGEKKLCFVAVLEDEFNQMGGSGRVWKGLEGLEMVAS